MIRIRINTCRARSSGHEQVCISTDSPDVSPIPPQDVLGVTVVLITCSYKGKNLFVLVIM